MQIRTICSRLLGTGAVILIALATPVFSQTAADTPPKDSSRRDDVSLLKQQIAEQQKEIEQLRTIVDQMQQKLGLSPNQAQSATKQAPSLGEVASTTPMVPKGDSEAVAGSNGRDSHSTSSSAAPAVGPTSARGLNRQGAQEKPKSSPLSVRLGDAEFTPSGFLDLTAFFRSTNLGSGIGTSFGSIPYSVTGGTTNPASQLTETRFSAQNSRVSLKATSKVGRNDVAGYVETDFVGNSATNLFQTSNSASLRLRLYWVDLLRGKWEILGGQSWSMMTPGRNGISPVPADLFVTQDMDTNYQVGLTWARQSQFRVVYHPSKEWAVGVSIENPDQFITGGVTLPGGSSGPYASQFDIGGNQTSTPNLMPDIIAKVAYDPMMGGKHMHAELGALLSSFKDYTGLTNTKSTKTGGGVTAGLDLEAAKDLHLILNGFYSAGGGRYIFGLAPDVVVKPDGTLATVRAGSGIAGFEYQLKKTMLYAYYGAAYIDSAAYVSSYGKGGVPTYVGYGYPGSPNSANRVVNEATFGFTQTFWKNPKYGALQWINQYSYLDRVPWYVAPGSSKNAHLSLVYTDLHYVLP
jgi:hypothetical protein